MSRRRAALAFALVGGLAAAPAPAPPAAGPVPPAEAAASERPELPYSVLYDVRLVPSERAARVAIRLGPGAEHVHSLRLRIDPARHTDLSADGELRSEPGFVTWKPPRAGGTLRYQFRIDKLRDERSYDARCGEDWALFRGDDLVPPVRTQFADGARSHARLRIRLPEGWSVATPYPRSADGTYSVAHPDRRFDRPTGWIVAGHLGVIRERVAGARVAIAGPAGHGLRRLDLMALLRWTLPTLRKVVDLPARILIVGAGDPMWRGGLSGPQSVFVHADRPLITTDVTSPLLHELVHMALRIRGGPGDDWIVEGLAELYSLELLVRSRTISRRRYDRALERLAEEGRRAEGLRAESAAGPVTALAVTTFRALDREIRASTGGTRDLDEVVREIARRRGTITTPDLRSIAEKVAGESLDLFFRRYVPERAGAAPARSAP
jgi:hypothetical protein